MEIENNYKYEQELYDLGYKLICGVDEVGRGPLIGPVVAAAVILPKDYYLEGLTDSKKISEKKRDKFYEIIIKDAVSYAICEVDEKIIDKINIYQASKLAMKKAIEMLNTKPDYILVDAMDLEMINSKGIIKGDLKSQTIAAASVLAKVHRDNLMKELHLEYPLYGFDKHKGYPTKNHLKAINEYGLIPGYRLTYGPVKRIIAKNNHLTK